MLPEVVEVEEYIAVEDGVVEDVSCGSTFSVALTSGGTPYQWGTINGRVYPVPQRVVVGIPLRCVQLACGRKHILALMEGGFVMSWGVGYFGQLGHGDDQSCERPRMLHHLDPQRLGDQVISVASGGLHSAVTTAGQLVFSFGFNRYGQCGQGSCSNKISVPKPVNMNVIGPARIRQLVCGRHHTAVLTDQGQLYTWGASSFGRLGLPDPKKVVPSPTEVPFFRSCPAHSVASGDFHMLALGYDFTVYAWGYGAEGQCGLGTTLHLRTPRPVDSLRGIAIERVMCGAWCSFAISVEGRLYCWGSGDGGWLGLDIPPPQSLPLVEPGPPMEKYGPSRAFDSDYNALLPELVVALARYRVTKAVGGPGHTLFLVSPAPPPQLDNKGGRLEELSEGMKALGMRGEEDNGRRAVAASKDDGTSSLIVGGGGGPMTSIGSLAKEDILNIFSRCRHNRLEEVHHALEQGLPMDVRDASGNTLLHVAAQNGLRQMCQLLVSAGVDINARNDKGNTACHYALAYGFKDVGQYLITAGCDEFIQNDEGLTCWEGLTQRDLANKWG